MWDQGGQPWPQWPLSQQQWMQSFQHQQDPGEGSPAAPNPSQVDWAALAQAWIAQKESTGTPVDQQQALQPNGQEVQSLEPVPNNHGNFQNDPAFNRMWQPDWGMHSQPPPPPPEQAWIPPGPGPMEVAPPSEDSNSQDSLEFGSDAHHGPFPQNSHGFPGTGDSFSMAPMAVNQFDYQHGAAAFGPPSSGFHPPYWPQGPPQNRRDRPPVFRERQRSPIQPPKQEPPALDAVKRRTLPAWIREGLEKMDREKQKKLEKERMERQRAEMSKDEEKGSDLAEEEGDGPRLPRKSKFDSDDEDEEEEEEEEEVEEEARAPVRKEFVSRSPSPPVEDHSEPEMTEEEREFQLMILTKTLLTEVLLEVTNEEIHQVAKETHRKATKAPAKQLAQSSALASLTGLGGLGDYGSDESDEGEERSAGASESSDTDEEELRHRIRQKQDAFRRQERELLLQQERRAQEGQRLHEDAAAGDRGDRGVRERGDYEEEEGEADSPEKEEVREREAEPAVERRRSRSEPEAAGATARPAAAEAAAHAPAPAAPPAARRRPLPRPRAPRAAPPAPPPRHGGGGGAAGRGPGARGRLAAAVGAGARADGAAAESATRAGRGGGAAELTAPLAGGTAPAPAPASAAPAGGVRAGPRTGAAENASVSASAAGTAAEAAGASRKAPARRGAAAERKTGRKRRKSQKGKGRSREPRRRRRRRKRRGRLAPQCRRTGMAGLRGGGRASTQTPAVRPPSSRARTAGWVGRARASPAGSRLARRRAGAGLPPPSLARKRNPKSPNVVAQDRRKNLTSLVRRQAANTSLSHHQGHTLPPDAGVEE